MKGGGGQGLISCTKFIGDFGDTRNTYEVLNISGNISSICFISQLSIGEYKPNFRDVRGEKICNIF